MPVTFIGEEKTTYRIQTGFWSLDRAFQNRRGDIGLPVRGMCQLAGYTGVGKSTLVYALSGIVAKTLEANIALADLEEHFDPQFMGTVLEHVGFDGTVYNCSGDMDHKKLDDMLDKLKDETYVVGIVDSIGAISPVAEAEGGLEDASMGRRAKLVAVLARRAIHLSNNRKKPHIVFVTNHVHPNIGSRGTVTSGGVVKDYLSTTQIRLSNKEMFDDGSFLIGGKVDKNSFGYSKRPFYVFNLVGYGIHPGMTAVYDCIMLGIAKLSRTVKLGDKSFGYIKQLIQAADDVQLFEPFHQALKEHSGDTVSSEEE